MIAAAVLVVDGPDLRRDDLEQELEPVGACGREKAADGRLLLGLDPGRIVGVAEAQDLDHMLDRPLAQCAAVVGLDVVLEAERAAPREFDRPADPQAGAGCPSKSASRPRRPSQRIP